MVNWSRILNARILGALASGTSIYSCCLILQEQYISLHGVRDVDCLNRSSSASCLNLCTLARDIPTGSAPLQSSDRQVPSPPVQPVPCLLKAVTSLSGVTSYHSLIYFLYPTDWLNSFVEASSCFLFCCGHLFLFFLILIVLRARGNKFMHLEPEAPAIVVLRDASL